LIPAAGRPGPYDWKTLTALKSGIQWPARGAGKIDLSFMNDTNPFGLTASATYAGRTYSVIASGSETQVKGVYFEEARLHARGEDVLAVLRSQGFTIQLARCGPVYTESTHNWYRVSSAKTQPVMLRQSIRRDGNQVQDSYALRLDGTLPARDPRDRDPGLGGCGL
jgi:hypothetical protein